MVSVVDASIVRFFAIQFVTGQELFLNILFSVIVILLGTSIYIFSNEIRKSLFGLKEVLRRDLFFLPFFKYMSISIIILLGISLLLVDVFNFYVYILQYLIIIIVHLECLIVFVWIIFKFIKWLSNNKNSIIFLFIFSFSIFSLFTVFSLFNYIFNLQDLTKHITHTPFYYIVYTVSLSLDQSDIQLVNFALSFCSFFMMWLTTALLLNQYIKNIKKQYFWLVISLPMFYYFVQFLFIELDFLSSLIFIDPLNNLILYEFLFLLSYPLVGIIFGISMLILSKKIKSDEVKKSLELLAIGFMLLFCGFQPNSLLYLPFPPFGISILLLGIGSFLIVIALYQSIYTITKNVAILQELRKTVGEKNFLVHLSEGKKVAELTDIVQQVNKSVEKSNFGINDPSSEDLTKDEISDLLEFIADELQRS